MRSRPQLSSRQIADAYEKLTPREKFPRLRRDESWTSTPSIVLAAMLNDLEMIKTLLSEGADPNASHPPHGHTGLIAAAMSNDLEVIRLLLGGGANPDQPDESGNTALSTAAANGHTDAVRLLLDKGANPLLKSRDGSTFLHTAAASNLETLRIALESTPTVNDQNELGFTPLIWAAQGRNPRKIRLLLEAGADARITANDGYSTLIAATTDDHAFRPANLECVKLLLQAGADVNATDGGGATALMGAAYYGGPAVARLLLDHGADPSVVDSRGRTALSLAVDNHQTKIAKILKQVTTPGRRNNQRAAQSK